jgi:hypothetical protein
MGHYSQDDIPSAPSAQTKERFLARFKTKDDVYRALKGPPLVERVARLWIDKVRATAASENSSIVKNIARVEDHVLSVMFASLSKYGFDAWHPDLSEPAYSIYNIAHRAIAITTFKDALIGHGYSFLSPNREYVNNTAFLIRLYDHFVFHYLKGMVDAEKRQPGGLSKHREMTNVYKRRREVGNYLPTF